MSGSTEIVVVDTGVFSATLNPARTHLVELYRDDLVGKRLVISFQTAAEMRYGALKARWGHTKTVALEKRLALAVVVPPHDDLSAEWAATKSDCQRVGHPFHHKLHTADLWIAATARLVDAPVITHDSGFLDVPHLTVIFRGP